MKIIKDSPEHHFLKLGEELKGSTDQWLALSFKFSSHIDHEKILANPQNFPEILSEITHKSDEFVHVLQDHFASIQDIYGYIFSDGDVCVVAQYQDYVERETFAAAGREYKGDLGANIVQFYDLEKDEYAFFKMIDQRMQAEKRIRAYHAMGDKNRVASIPIRRKKRETPSVLMIEDDQFTGNYAMKILSKDYESICVKSGEDGIQTYIDHAPDIVFLDIHLPGMNGHSILKAIKAIDPEAYVVMLSVDTAKTSVMAAGKTGASGFLKKPFSRDRLVNTVERSPFVSDLRISASPMEPPPETMH